MAKTRFEHIDFLRAVAIIGVIVTHILSYNLGTTLTNTIWNYLHFVVPVLIFCSGYVMYQKYATVRWTKESLVAWYKKRSIRLLQPYALWTLLHYALWYVFPKYFSGLGLDYGWLPLLFIELMIVTPFYLSVWKNQKLLLTMLISASTIVLLFFKPSINYQFYMWIPWSIVLLLSFASFDKPFYYITTVLTKERMKKDVIEGLIKDGLVVRSKGMLHLPK